MADLSEKDYEILDFIKDELIKNGFPPSVREIGEKVGLKSTATIHARLRKLEEHGKIIRDSSKNRSIKVVGMEEENISKIEYVSDKYIDVPVYGNVAAGLPITAVDEVNDTFPLPISYAKNKDLFMLKVTGESMINAAILDGDMIIVSKQPDAKNGDIVVALLDNENATVKTFYKENGYIRLQPENDAMEPIIVKDVKILGKVIGIFRKL
ncbi:MAG: transcriptional repressor LexA [Clostridia bacterium]|nr:transcriptional repressor LexA [Clostridia bacterium]